MTGSTPLRLTDALEALAHELVVRLAADAAIFSRVIGDVLIIVTRTAADEHPASLGQGYLVSDYPLTQRVLETGAPELLTIADDGVDPNEAAILRELGYSTLLMLPLEVAGARWGLVELYRVDVRPFTPADAELAAGLARVG